MYSVIYQSFILFIPVKPTNVTISGGGRFNVTSQINLTCTAIGVPLPTIMWQHNNNTIPIDPGCVLDPYNVTSIVGSGLFPDNCSMSITLNLVNTSLVNVISNPQDISVLTMYNLNDLVVESYLSIRSIERSDNGIYTCTITNTLLETDTTLTVSGPTAVVVLGKTKHSYNVLSKVAIQGIFIHFIFQRGQIQYKMSLL